MVILTSIGEYIWTRYPGGDTSIGSRMDKVQEYAGQGVQVVILAQGARWTRYPGGDTH